MARGRAGAELQRRGGCPGEGRGCQERAAIFALPAGCAVPAGWEKRLATPVPRSYTDPFHPAGRATVAQSAEHRFCKPAVVSSILTGSFPGRRLGTSGQVAEWPIAPDCKSGGRRPSGVRIPPCPIANIGYRGCSSIGRALAFQASFCGFESRRPLILQDAGHEAVPKMWAAEARIGFSSEGQVAGGRLPDLPGGLPTRPLPCQQGALHRRRPAAQTEDAGPDAPGEGASLCGLREAVLLYTSWTLTTDRGSAAMSCAWPTWRC